MTRRRIAVLASGGGRSLENLAQCAAVDDLPIEIACVLVDRKGIGVIERCARLDLACEILPWKDVGGAEGFAARAFERLRAERVELVVLAGFLRLLLVPKEWNGRVINIHPALLPSFGGKGFYGDRVHAAVLASGARETGCTVHHVDQEYDHGQPILQRSCPVLPGDTPETLAARVFEEEKLALPEAIRRVLAALPSGPAGP